MPRPRTPVSRPPCPKGHIGDVWLDGFYAKGSAFERPRFRCVPRVDPKTRKRPALHANGEARHKFVEPLARRHERGTHPACRNCEHVLDRHEGPQTARGHVFSIHEAARDLMAVGTGASLRGSSRRIRREAGRTTVSAWGNITAPHAQLASEHLGSFGQVILDTFAPPSLLASAGRPAAARRRLDDVGPSSLHEAVGRVMLRTARKRRQNRRHARASWWRKRAAGMQRTAPRPSRVSWPAGP